MRKEEGESGGKGIEGKGYGSRKPPEQGGKEESTETTPPARVSFRQSLREQETNDETLSFYRLGGSYWEQCAAWIVLNSLFRFFFLFATLSREAFNNRYRLPCATRGRRVSSL